VLHCPATIIVARPDGAEARTSLIQRIRVRRVAFVYSGADPADVELAEALAAELGVGAATLGELDGFRPAGASSVELTDRLQGVADLHRGETVLVIADRVQAGDDSWEIELGDEGLRVLDIRP